MPRLQVQHYAIPLYGEPSPNPSPNPSQPSPNPAQPKLNPSQPTQICHFTVLWYSKVVNQGAPPPGPPPCRGPLRVRPRVHAVHLLVNPCEKQGKTRNQEIKKSRNQEKEHAVHLLVNPCEKQGENRNQEIKKNEETKKATKNKKIKNDQSTISLKHEKIKNFRVQEMSKKSTPSTSDVTFSLQQCPGW